MQRTFEFSSDALGRNVPVTILEPEHLDDNGRCKTLFALHGMGGKHTDWIENARLDDYVAQLCAVTVLPTGDDAFYMDSDVGGYETFITQELTAFVDAQYPTVTKAGSRGILGLSMGGWGALILALRNPLVFGAAASHSGAVRFNLAENWDVADRIFGPGDDGQRRRDEHDVVQLAAAYLTPPPTDDDRPGYCGPAIYFDCGVSDFLFDTNRSLANALRAAQVPYEYHEYPGAHEWIYWDRHATDSLRFLARKLGITGA